MQLRTALLAATMFSLGAVLSPGAHVASAAQTEPPACSAAQPIGAPLTITGTGQMRSAPFALAGGAYTVDWSMAGPSTALSFIELESADDPSVLRSETILNGKAGSSGQTHVYKVKPGPYYLDVRAPAGWSVTLTPLAV